MILMPVNQTQARYNQKTEARPMKTAPEKPAQPLADTIETLLEERKNSSDRRASPEVRLPESVERRKRKDRRSA